jgi:gliding motility-associated-like protein
VLSIDGADKQYETCQGIPVTLIGEAPTGASFQWEDEDGTILRPYSTATDDLELTVTPVKNTTYYLAIKTATCSAKTVHIVTTYDLHVTIAGGNQTICPGDLISLVADTAGTNTIHSNFNITWTKEEDGKPETTSSFSNSLTTSASPDVKTIYTVNAINNTCRQSASILVSMHPIPVITEVLTDEPKIAEIIATGGNMAYFEYSVDDTITYDYDNMFENLRVGKHIAYIKDENNCKNSLSFFMPEIPLEFPIFFTPDANGLSDTWIITNLEFYPKINLQIFDRFGRQLAEINDSSVDAAWNGRYKGKLLNSDDYWYVLYIEETRRVYKGHFTLVNR